jgi:hypothetical protein
VHAFSAQENDGSQRDQRLKANRTERQNPDLQRDRFAHELLNDQGAKSIPRFRTKGLLVH